MIMKHNSIVEHDYDATSLTIRLPLRPRHLPSFVGITYWHIAYRLYVRLLLQSGIAIEGLYFLRSDCDSRFIAITGNLMTDFRFHTANIRV
jgi:hypothetical protein